jgi:hypothetical protein
MNKLDVDNYGLWGGVSQSCAIYNTCPKTTYSILIGDGSFRIHRTGKPPNRWYRFWYKCLLGWTIEVENE